jgi:predicted nucleic acid-binding protein
VELADTSAWSARHRDTHLARAFATQLAEGQVATCDPVRFELLFMARDAREFDERRQELATLAHCAVAAGEWQRALDVMAAVARRGPLHHRQTKLPDLLIAAAAESAEMPVLHYDHHFELIAEVTGQPVRAIAPLGSL